MSHERLCGRNVRALALYQLPIACDAACASRSASGFTACFVSGPDVIFHRWIKQFATQPALAFQPCASPPRCCPRDAVSLSVNMAFCGFLENVRPSCLKRRLLLKSYKYLRPGSERCRTHPFGISIHTQDELCQFESFHDERRRFPAAVEEILGKALLTSDSTAQMAEKTF